MYYYFNTQSVYPYYNPHGIGSVPVRYVPTHVNEPIQSWNTLIPQRQFPPVNIHKLDISVHKFQALMRQADLLINKLADDPVFTKELMSAAQQSNHRRVNELILSTGITLRVKTTFTPTGIKITIDNSGIEGDCCDLLIGLRW